MKRRGFKHWLSNYKLPESIDDAELEAIYPLVMAGSKAAITRFAEGHIRLAFAVVANYANMFPSESDEFVSIAFHTILIVTNKIREKAIVDSWTGNRNIGALIGTAIQNNILNYLKSRKRKSKYSSTFNEQDIPNPDSRLQAFEILELIYASIKTEQERKVVQYLKDGLSDVEIGREMQLTKARVGQIRHGIRDRLKEIMV